MSVVYSAISAVLLFWHAAWHLALGDARNLGTSWSWVLGIVSLVLTVRAALFPVLVRQVRSQRAMQLLRPKVKALQAKHRTDPESLWRQVASLYRAERVSPVASVLPALVQTPALLGLLHVLRHLDPGITGGASRTLYGWTAMQFQQASHATLFGAPLAASFHSSAAQLQLLGATGGPVKIVAAVLVAAMIVTTFLTSRRAMAGTGRAQDPKGRTVQRLMLYGIPLSLLLSGAVFPLGVVLYWTTQNLFTLGQQRWILRRFPPQHPADTGPNVK